MKSLIAFLIFFIPLSCIGQQNEKFSIEVFAGPSMPLGKFADKSYSQFNNSSGLAKVGFSFGSDVKFKMKNNFGIALDVSYSLNKQDKRAIENYINRGSNYPLNTKIEVNSWQIARGLVGLYYQHLFKRTRLGFEISILAGVSKTAIPPYNWQVYTQSGNLYNSAQENKKQLNWMFSYKILSGINYKLNNRMYFLLNVSYFNAQTSRATSNLKYWFGSADVNGGLGFLL